VNETDENYYWNEVYSSNVNTVWGDSEPDSRMRELVLTKLRNYRGKSIRVLDIGCGNGRNSKIFNELPFIEVDYYGIDFAPAVIEYCTKTYNNRTFFYQDITRDIELPEKKFELIIDFGCFHCLTPEKRKKYAENIIKISGKDTLFIMRAWYGDEKPVKQKPDFITYLVLNVWFVNILDVKSLFCPDFQLEHYFLEKNPPYDINNGMIYFILKRS